MSHTARVLSGTPVTASFPGEGGVDLVDRGGTGIRRYGLDKFDAGDVSLICGAGLNL